MQIFINAPSGNREENIRHLIIAQLIIKYRYLRVILNVVKNYRKLKS